MARLLPLLLLAALGGAAKLKRQPAAWDERADGNGRDPSSARPPHRAHGPQLGGCPAPRSPAQPRPVPTAGRAPRGCANLTLILDNWRFAITSQLRNLLLFHHHTVLPDYGRIRALSGALDELYEDFSALKEQLGRLSGRFVEVEAFVDQLSRSPGPRVAPGPGSRRRGSPQPALK